MSADVGPIEDGWLGRFFRRVRAWVNMGLLAAVLAVSAVVLVPLSYAVFAGYSGFNLGPQAGLALLITDVIVGFGLAGMLGWQFVRLWSARRSGLAGSRLHSKLIGVFSAIAVTPAIIVAVFSLLIFNSGIETWFSKNVNNALSLSDEIALDYVFTHRKTLEIDMEIFDGQMRAVTKSFEDGNIDRDMLDAQMRQLILLRMKEGGFITIAVVSPDQPEPLFHLGEPIEADQMPNNAMFEKAAGQNGYVYNMHEFSHMIGIYKDPFRPGLFFLFVRPINAAIFEAQRDLRAFKGEYDVMDDDRNIYKLTLALFYVMIGLVLLASALWFGMWLSNRLVVPIGRLVGAAERISDGDLGARVEVPQSDDEISTLGRTFNHMTGQLQSQRNELIEANRQFDQRRRFTEAVLSGVSSGVVGLDFRGRITIANQSATELLETQEGALLGKEFVEVLPEFAGLIHQAMTDTRKGARNYQAQIDLERNGHQHSFNVRINHEVGDVQQRGFVVTFDEITELVLAQRTAAWGDVARRIAHEIKNPLTPIQLSAERLRRKYKKEIETDPEVFDQCTDTIIRQVGDLGRMVDEFASFARMPTAVMKDEDICDIVRQAVFLQTMGNQAISFTSNIPDDPILLPCDSRLVSQAMTNILKNAGEAVASKAEAEGKDFTGKIHSDVCHNGTEIVITVTDNGCGLPVEHRQRLTEPYMTTREKGTGLGLAIVNKVMEDHGGTLVIGDALSDKGEVSGARIQLVFPYSDVQSPRNTETEELAEGVLQLNS